ncbi:MAG: hypothetical protein ACUVWO_11315 [Thermodesulfobacteriota bacterium]
MRKLGGESLLLYPAGGLTGYRLKDLLEEEGITHRPVPIEGMTQESLVVLEESTGQQFRFGMPGPALSNEENVREFREIVGQEIKEESQIEKFSTRYSLFKEHVF